MTTHSDDRPMHPATTVRVDAAGEMIAAIPAMLGFTPRRSIMVMCLQSDGRGSYTAGTIMRHDLDVPECHIVDEGSLFVISNRMLEVIGRFGDQCRVENAYEAVAFVVDDRGSEAVSEPMFDMRFEALAQCLLDELGDRGTELLRVVLTTEITAGADWISLTGDGDRGSVADPRSSPVTLAYALDGRAVLPSRDAVAEVMQPVDDDVSRQVALLVPRARVDRSGSDAEHLTRILEIVESATSPTPDLPPVVELSIETAAAVGVSLLRVMVRDSLLALVLTDVARIAEMLWTDLVRVLPPPERAAAATLLAFSAYARGDGATAATALVVALDADPTYSLASLLDRSLDAGAGPALIREVASSGYAVADLCGVRLPLPTSAI